MGLEVLVTTAVCEIGVLLERLRSAGAASELIMLDGALVAPSAAVPSSWRDVRLRTPAGTVTLTRRPGGVAVMVFGNADPALLTMQKSIAALLAT